MMDGQDDCAVWKCGSANEEVQRLAIYQIKHTPSLRAQSRKPCKLSQCRKLHDVLPSDATWAEISFSAVERTNRRPVSAITQKRASNSRS
jgi:hypothetical protein